MQSDDERTMYVTDDVFQGKGTSEPREMRVMCKHDDSIQKQRVVGCQYISFGESIKMLSFHDSTYELLREKI